MTTSPCPSREVLRAFHLGVLAETEAEQVIDHVGECPTCQIALETIDDAGDPVFQLVRGPAVVDPYAQEADCQEAVARIAQLSTVDRTVGQPFQADSSVGQLFQADSSVGQPFQADSSVVSLSRLTRL